MAVTWIWWLLPTITNRMVVVAYNNQPDQNTLLFDSIQRTRSHAAGGATLLKMMFVGNGLDLWKKDPTKLEFERTHGWMF